jgi:hypothetical protein
MGSRHTYKDLFQLLQYHDHIGIRQTIIEYKMRATKLVQIEYQEFTASSGHLFLSSSLIIVVALALKAIKCV